MCANVARWPKFEVCRLNYRRRLRRFDEMARWAANFEHDVVNLHEAFAGVGLPLRFGVRIKKSPRTTNWGVCRTNWRWTRWCFCNGALTNEWTLQTSNTNVCWQKLRRLKRTSKLTHGSSLTPSHPTPPPLLSSISRNVVLFLNAVVVFTTRCKVTSSFSFRFPHLSWVVVHSIGVFVSSTYTKEFWKGFQD